MKKSARWLLFLFLVVSLVVPSYFTESVFAYSGMVKPVDVPDYVGGVYTTEMDPYDSDNDDYDEYSVLYRDHYLGKILDKCGEGWGRHPGVDIRIVSGTPVKAIADGIVKKAECTSGGWGGLVIIEHTDIPGTDGPIYSAYAHLKQIDVCVDDPDITEENEGIVSKGQIIGLSGGALTDPCHGNSTGAHLHFQIDKSYIGYPWYPGFPEWAEEDTMPFDDNPVNIPDDWGVFDANDNQEGDMYYSADNSAHPDYPTNVAEYRSTVSAVSDFTYNPIAFIQSHQPDLTLGLTAHYHFNGNAQDQSGNENHGTVYGATLTEDMFGNPDSAYSFDGVDDWINIDNKHPFMLDEWTISAWIKVREFPALQVGCSVIGKDDDNNWKYNFSLMMHNNGHIASQYETCSSEFDHGVGGDAEEGEINLNKWYFATSVRDRETGRHSLWINVVKVDEEIWLDTPCQNDEYLMIAKSAQENQIRYLNCILDEIRIYSRALSEIEIQQLFW